VPCRTLPDQALPRRAHTLPRRKPILLHRRGKTSDQNQNGSNLKRFGSLLIDPKTIVAIAPLFAANDIANAYGFRVITLGGPLDVTDKDSGDAIYAYLTSHVAASVT
jgi:hypothetical protein